MNSMRMAPRIPPATQLSLDLYRNLVDQLYAVPPSRRARSCWVMNQEWYDECRKIGDWPEPGVTTLLGLPFVVTADGGFPHLITD